MARIQNLQSHPERFVTVREAREYLHVSDSYIRKLVAAGTLRRLRVPHGSRIVRIAVDDLKRAFPSAT